MEDELVDMGSYDEEEEKAHSDKNGKSEEAKNENEM